MDRRSFSKALAAGCLLPFVNTRFGGTGYARAATPGVSVNAVTRVIEVNGMAATVFGLIGPDGKPGLSLDADAVTNVDLISALSVETMIHWHGLTPPWPQDGVPGMPIPLLAAGETRTHSLPGGRPGTHWMHAHSLQEQALLAAPLIVRGTEEQARDAQDVVILLHDFSWKSPEELLAGLQTGAAMGGMDMSSTVGMTMAPDLNDIQYDAYLANDRTLDDPEVVTVDRGGMVRVRIINGATATGFTMDVGALQAQVIAVDGQDITPLAATTFPLSMGQRVDFLCRIPVGGGAFPILALREGAPERAGIVLATNKAVVEKLPVAGATNGPVLTLDSKAVMVTARPLDAATPARRFALDLTGTMQGYAWAIEMAAPIRVVQGDRAEMTFRNITMMAHPMHLHGYHFQVVAINGRASDTDKHDSVPPGFAATVYTCPMHDEVRSPTAGLCPICNMTLVPESKSATRHDRAGRHPERDAFGAT